MKGSEKREYFRVRDDLEIKFRELDDAEFENLCQSLRNELGASIHDVMRASLSKRDYNDKFSAILEYLISIDRKLSAIIDLLGRQSEKNSYVEGARTLDISGSGIRFLSNFRPEKRFLELVLELPVSGGRRIKVLSEIVRVRKYESDPDLWEIAARYKKMEEEERDILISYLLSKEREYISSMKMDD